MNNVTIKEIDVRTIHSSADMSWRGRATIEQKVERKVCGRYAILLHFFFFVVIFSSPPPPLFVPQGHITYIAKSETEVTVMLWKDI